MYIILVSTAVLLWRKRLIELIPAKEARLEQFTLTVQQLREKLGEWGGSGKKFNQAKTKEDKQVVVLEAYYMKFLHAEPEKQASNEKTPTPKAAVTTSKQSQKEEVPKSVQIETAKNFKADVSSSILSEEPPPLGKILVLEKGWLDKILEGEKTLELRKTLIDEKEHMYLAAKDCIYAKCMVSDPIEICNSDEFESLMEAHQCTNPPYSFPMVGHRISKVQKLTPLRFNKLRGAVGRALYRPLSKGEEGGKEDAPVGENEGDVPVGEEDVPVVEEGPGSAKTAKPKAKGAKKTGPCAKKKAEQPKKNKKKGPKTAKATEALKLSQPDLLQGQSVKLVDHKERVLLLPANWGIQYIHESIQYT